MSNIKTKKCSSCKDYLPLTEFNKNSYKSDGLDTMCRDCRVEYREQHRDYYREYNRKYINSKKHNYIYFIIQDKQIVYIGSTIHDLSYRIRSHINLYSNIRNYMKRNTWTKIAYVEVDDELSKRELRAVEQIFIEEICTILNKNCASNFNDIDNERMEIVSELAYHYLDNIENYCKIYKTNYSNTLI